MATDEKLRQLAEDCARKKKLDCMLGDLQERRKTLQLNVQRLERAKHKEQSDVDKLEGHSLAAFFYGVIGKMDEKLTQERQEAYAARVRYDAAIQELTALEEEIQDREEEREKLLGCEQRYQEYQWHYQQELREKQSRLKAAGGKTAENILHLEEKLNWLCQQKRETQEAICAGEAALAGADRVLSSLDDANGWATWDMFGGGLMTDIMKYSRLDDAQAAVGELQIQLGRFKTELADVRIDADMRVNVDGFLRFADCFFDNLFTDWAVMDEINQSRSQVFKTRGQIEEVLRGLHSAFHQMEGEAEQVQGELDQLVQVSVL